MLIRAGLFVLFSCILSSVLSLESPVKRNRFANNLQEQQNPISSPSYQYEEEEEDYNYNTPPPSPPPLSGGEGEGGCSVAVYYKGSIPTGMTEEDYFKPISIAEGDNVYEQCLKECCKLGPDHCQYTWIFRGECFAVGCTKLNAAKCKPKKVKSLKKSVYLRMAYQEDNMDSPPPVHVASTASLDQPPTTKATPLPPSPLTTAPPPPTNTSSPSLTQHTDNKGIMISFAGDTNLTFPVNSTHLFSSTWPTPKPSQKYKYRWEKVSGPNYGTIRGSDTADVLITGMVPGVYVLRLTVEHLGVKLGEDQVNITVHSPVRINSPPVPVISPTQNAVVTLPRNGFLFDASGSHDDLPFDTLTFQWEEVEGPVDSTLTSDSPLLQVTDLKEGNYKYKLTVTDQDGLSSTAFVSVKVNPAMSYPPLASAGEDQVIKLPNDEVTLDGSGSTAFKGDLRYSWEKISGPGPLDMKGTDMPFLHLYHISTTGDYVFRLTVTDILDHMSSVDVSLVVLPEHNLPPVALAGRDMTVSFPTTTALLNGNASYDDYKIDSWLWEQLSGPNDVTLSGVTSPYLSVEGLHIDEVLGSPTPYTFQLLIWDYHNLTNTSNVTITYRKDPRIPPLVSIGPPRNISLPQNSIILNGSTSHDDFGISSYQWHRSESSPASGLVAHGSDKTAVLILSGLVEGTYNFTLTVVSRDMVAASDSVSITVLPNPMDNYILMVEIEGEASIFTLADQKQLERVLSLILDDVDMDYAISVVAVRSQGHNTLVEFYASPTTPTTAAAATPINATVAYNKLTELGQDYYYPNSNFHFVDIKMKVCQLPCSGHGSCDKNTHKCTCIKFWMENPIKAHFGKKETNCEWSVFYVALACIVGVAALLFLVWLACCCCMKKRRISRTKRRIRYAILDHKDNESCDGLGYQRTSLMVSESEGEDDILYESAHAREFRESTPSSNVQMVTTGERNGVVSNGKVVGGKEITNGNVDLT